MTEPLRPPYVLPGLEALRKKAQTFSRNLHNIRITRTVANPGTYLNVAATYINSGRSGPGTEIGLYWAPRNGPAEPEPALRVGDQTCPYAGPFDLVDAEARGLLRIDWVQPEELLVAIEQLWELRELAEECWRTSENEASLYASPG
ncbi:hypothetical protein [Arthrobacter sp. 92]|uniref:hypothetical protein n=1 Tax=Arthrobacter sp. 92 TaxID=3418175 RepID=UPI003CFDE82F